MPDGKQQDETPVKKTIFLGEYNMQMLRYNFISLNLSCKKFSPANNALIADCFIAMPGKPPQAIV
jgi:hypothetical protein